MTPMTVVLSKTFFSYFMRIAITLNYSSKAFDSCFMAARQAPSTSVNCKIWHRSAYSFRKLFVRIISNTYRTLGHHWSQDLVQLKCRNVAILNCLKSEAKIKHGIAQCSEAELLWGQCNNTMTWRVCVQIGAKRVTYVVDGHKRN